MKVTSKCFETNAQKIAHLKEHEKVHSEERPVPCLQCNKKFKSLDSLKVHIKIHTGERPFPCNLCENRFIDSQNLKRHQITHTK